MAQRAAIADQCQQLGAADGADLTTRAPGAAPRHRRRHAPGQASAAAGGAPPPRRRALGQAAFDRGQSVGLAAHRAHPVGAASPARSPRRAGRRRASARSTVTTSFAGGVDRARARSAAHRSGRHDPAVGRARPPASHMRARPRRGRASPAARRCRASRSDRSTVVQALARRPRRRRPWARRAGASAGWCSVAGHQIARAAHAARQRLARARRARSARPVQARPASTRAGDVAARRRRRAGRSTAQVLAHGEVRIERERPAARRRAARRAAPRPRRLAVDLDGAAIEREPSADRAHQRRLAGAIRPDQRDERAARHRHVDASSTVRPPQLPCAPRDRQRSRHGGASTDVHSLSIAQRRRRRRSARDTLAVRWPWTCVIVGGGLAGSLAAWRLATARPELDVALLEPAPTLGGNHTWSLHDDDLTPAQLAWLAPLVAPALAAARRGVPGPRADDRPRLRRHCPRTRSTRWSRRRSAPRCGSASRCESVSRHRVVPGRRAHRSTPASSSTRAVRRRSTVPLGWQTFLGQELECAAPHGVDRADADGRHGAAGRRVQVRLRAAVGSADRLLVEDTAYADTPGRRRRRRRARAIAAYVERPRLAGARRWSAKRRGSLPIPLGGDGEAFWSGDVPRLGMRAGLFHPTTGYSLPDAVATADLLARRGSLRRRRASIHRCGPSRPPGGRTVAFFRLLEPPAVPRRRAGGARAGARAVLRPAGRSHRPLLRGAADAARPGAPAGRPAAGAVCAAPWRSSG